MSKYIITNCLRKSKKKDLIEHHMMPLLRAQVMAHRQMEGLRNTADDAQVTYGPGSRPKYTPGKQYAILPFRGIYDD